VDTAALAILITACASLGTVGVSLLSKWLEDRRTQRQADIDQAKDKAQAVTLATQVRQSEIESAAKMLDGFAIRMEAIAERERVRREESDAKVDRLTVTVQRLTIALRDRLPVMVATCPHMDPNCPGLRFAASLNDLLAEAETAIK
jgi:hypothetical protein